MRSRLKRFPITMRVAVRHSKLIEWFCENRERILWCTGGIAALTVVLLSCSTTTRTILAPPSIPGAKYVGSSECAECQRIYARFFYGDSCALKGSRRERQGRRLRIVSRAGQSSCRKRRWATHDREPAQISGHMLPMPPGSARGIRTALSSRGAGRESELR